MRKQCNFCSARTHVGREDLHEVKWSAFQIGKDKTIYSCPFHNTDLRKLMMESMEKKDVNVLEDEQ